MSKLDELARRVGEQVEIAVHEGHRVTRRCHARIAEHAAKAALREMADFARFQQLQVDTEYLNRQRRVMVEECAKVGDDLLVDGDDGICNGTVRAMQAAIRALAPEESS